jgi:hypothetical protein
VALKREYQTRECGALKLRRKKWLAIVRCTVDDERTARSQWECGRDSCVLECIGRNHRQRGCLFGIRYLGFGDRCRERDVMSQADQRLSKSFEERNIFSDQNHFRHYRNLRVFCDRERKLIEAVTSI